MKEKKGKLKQVTGFVTGDRHVEAEGRVEQRAADPGDPVQDLDERNLHDEERSVRREHGDIPARGNPPKASRKGSQKARSRKR